MSVNMQACLVGNDRYLFVNTQRANPSIKTVSRFLSIKHGQIRFGVPKLLKTAMLFFTGKDTTEKTDIGIPLLTIC